MSIDPLQRALQQAEAREAAHAQLLEEQRQQAKAHQDELAQEQQRIADQLARERQQAAEAMAMRIAEQRLRAENERKARKFVAGLKYVVATHATENGWSSSEIREASEYLDVLVLEQDTVLPSVCPKVAEVVESKFRFGLKLAADNNRSLPDGFLVGQRQEWFTAPSRAVTPAPPAVLPKLVITAPSVFDQKERAVTIRVAEKKDVEPLREAITPPGNKKNRRGKRKQLASA